jgi:hypothetical protein
MSGHLMPETMSRIPSAHLHNLQAARSQISLLAKGKDKGYPRTGQENLQGEKWYKSALSIT